jgi:hypothetical protein
MLSESDRAGERAQGSGKGSRIGQVGRAGADISSVESRLLPGLMFVAFSMVSMAMLVMHAVMR